MAQEKLDQISDQELFDSTLTDEAPPVEPIQEAEKPTEEAKPEEAKPDRERDEQGRFVAKEQAEEQPAEPQEPAPQPEQPQEEKGDVPSWRLKEELDAKRAEAEARRAAEARAEAAEHEKEQFRILVWNLQQQLKAKEQPEEPIDIFADPAAYQNHVSQTVDQRLRAMEGNFSLRLAQHRHGDVFQQAWSDMVSRTQAGDDTMRQQVLNSPDPGETLVQLYQREQVVKEVGNDPTAYRNKVLEDALKDPQFLSKALEAAKGAAQASPQPKPQLNLPPSINKATGARQAADDDTDMSDGALYSFATR